MSHDYPSYANLENLKMLEVLYEKWMGDPKSVDPSWQHFFEGMELASQLPKALPARTESADMRIHMLIHAYRSYGHLYAHCNVLEEARPPFPSELGLQNFALSEKDLDSTFPTGGVLEKGEAPLREIIEALQATYCRTIGVEYMDLGSPAIEKWIQHEIEPYFPTHLSNEEKVTILEQLNEAEGFETFLHTKYVGQKRFSLEGAETFIPMLHAILDTGGAIGVSDVALGMAHRGRLNVLANILGKSYEYIFEEFEDHFTPDLSESTGDVKYHMGFAGTYTTEALKKIQVVLAANPSHLEAVGPVVEGGARAIQEQKKPKGHRHEVLPILIHGDAAVAGQGVVYETLACSRLNGYNTKGTIHIVINNQVGFTTLPKDSRSTRYCTDLAKAFGAPIFHVNAEDPEGCVAACRLATKLRQEFQCDVFIDLMGYRKYGHNESDEPTFTQPLQYELIRAKKTIRQIYRDHLIQTGIIDEKRGDEIETSFRADLTRVLETVKSKVPESKELRRRKSGKDLQPIFDKIETKVDKETLLALGNKVAEIPEGVNLHPKVQRLLKERQMMLTKDSVDWGMGEMLAYASLAHQKIHVRLSGQDVRRGTFSHRHALYVDQLTSEHYFPLSHLGDGAAPCDVFNSPLSEYAVMAFDYGYSLLYPNSLVLWEGQFGDFANGAQIVIDQFLATGEMKWGHATNFTLLLPHGFEGMGPEHSSARIERFLQLCADENMILANCTTPAQLFHLLRRQAMRTMKKPLVVFTPKALLRHPKCRSPVEDFTSKTFEEILDDPAPPESPKRLVLCTGKFYYQLLDEREKRNAQDVLVRIEQLYPLHQPRLAEIFAKYDGVEECIFVQEEHKNMGAWPFLRLRLTKLLGGKVPLRYVARPRAASPAAGSHALHKVEHEEMMRQLYGER